jgi:NhaP-type Na+/H+ or K+/H+ antiporter
MQIGFGDALVIVGLLLTVSAALSGVMRGTVLSISILGVTLGIVLALADVVSVDANDESIVHVITLALLLTLFADGLVVEGELLARHWGPPARALAFAMPITLVLLAVAAHTLFGELSWTEAFLLGAVLAPTDPVITSAVVTSQRVPAVVRHTLNLESGLNDGLALPIVLFFLAVVTPGVDAGSEGAKVLGEAAFGGVVGVVLGVAGGRLHQHLPGGGITRRYEGLYAIGIGIAAYGVADVTFGNGLIAAFVAGIVLGAAEHDIPRNFVDFSENVSAVFQVLTFFIFGALIVATGYHRSIWQLVVFIPFALLVARPAAVLFSLAGTGLPRAQRLFISWFGPKGVASVLFALLVLDRGAENAPLIFDVAAFVVLASIVAHGLTDTVGSKWIQRRMSEPER